MMEETPPSDDINKEQNVMDTAVAAVPETNESNVSSNSKDPNKNNGDDISQERWYAAEDGSYFMERRDPFFYTNLCSYLITMGVFIYMAVVITKDFIDQQDDPPTSTKVNKEIDQPFPGIILCNRNDQAPLDLILALFEDESGEQDISSQVKEVDCGDNSPSCLLLDGQFRAFEPDPNNNRRCAESNTITLTMDINIESYSNETVLAGVDGYLFQPGSSDKIEESFCFEIAPGCKTLAPTTEDCPEDLSALSLDTFVTSANEGNLVVLERSEIQSGPTCDLPVLQWNPVSTSMQFNPAALPIEQSDTIVFIELEFSNPRVAKTTYNPITGQSMFGSLSGWFGFLTDGWGAISVLFFTERTFMFLRDRRRR